MSRYLGWWRCRSRVTKHVVRVAWVTETERERERERGANFDSSIVSSLLPLNNFFAVETGDPFAPDPRDGITLYCSSSAVLQ